MRHFFKNDMVSDKKRYDLINDLKKIHDTLNDTLYGMHAKKTRTLILVHGGIS